MTQARVRVLTREGCHLCDDALAVVARVCDELGVGWEDVDIDEDPQLREAYTDQVPVTFVDGQQHDFWRVDERRLRDALSGR
ncbi:NrdH-redoxin [Enemella dayhoffiae]|uniref:NrdH-redoxin n=1 Tax=Enemella dayhoffiae TaxID=2016507 RepID=A0A255H6J4_9ACTN|nr:glutaredoxin family protein [Enemella dayhoffiae]OYO22793.1 NrdH-redoxin [Enemella dayhoffiae]